MASLRVWVQTSVSSSGPCNSLIVRGPSDASEDTEASSWGPPVDAAAAAAAPPPAAAALQKSSNMQQQAELSTVCLRCLTDIAPLSSVLLLLLLLLRVLLLLPLRLLLCCCCCAAAKERQTDENKKERAAETDKREGPFVLLLQKTITSSASRSLECGGGRGLGFRV